MMTFLQSLALFPAMVVLVIGFVPLSCDGDAPLSCSLSSVRGADGEGATIGMAFEEAEAAIVGDTSSFESASLLLTFSLPLSSDIG